MRNPFTPSAVVTIASFACLVAGIYIAAGTAAALIVGGLLGLMIAPFVLLIEG